MSLFSFTLRNEWSPNFRKLHFSTSEITFLSAFLETENITPPHPHSRFFRHLYYKTVLIMSCRVIANDAMVLNCYNSGLELIEH